MRGGSQYEKTMFGGAMQHLGRGTRLSGPGNVLRRGNRSGISERTGDSGRRPKRRHEPRVRSDPGAVGRSPDATKWESGTCIVVTVKAKIKTLDPYITTGEHGKKAVVTVENLDGLSGSNCQEQVFNYLKQNGFTDEAACGVLGNIEQESGFDSTKLQGNGPAAGLFQLENYKTKSGRWKNLDTFAQARGKTWDNLACQLDFMIYELSGGESTATSKMQHMYPNGINGFKQETDIEKATKNFEESYERAGIPAMANRYAAAHRYYSQFHR